MNPIRLISAVVTACFVLQEAVWAAPISATAAQPMPLPPPMAISQFINDPARIDMPLEHVTVQEIHPGTNGKLIIHIQDAHANLSGQQSLAKALDKLLTQYDLRLVLVEGASRDSSLDEIRKLAPLKEWSIIARRFLYEGIISGEEYLNLTTEHPMKIIGVEYRDLYDEAVKAYAAIVDRRKDILHYLYQAKVSLDRLKVRMYPKELKAYEDRKGPNDGTSTVDFKTGFTDLIKLADAAQYPLTDMPQVRKLKELMEKESMIDFDKAGKEQEAILKGLSTAGADEDVREFTEASRRLRYSQVSQYLLVQKLLQTASKRDVAIENFPELMTYAEYLEKFTDLKMESLMTELEYLEDKVYETLLPDDDARKVRAIDRFLGLLGNAYKLQMSSHDFGMFTFNEKDFKTEGWLAFMNRQLVDLGFFESLVPYKSYLEDARSDFGRFYQLVGERDLAFVENANRIMAEQHENAAVLIAGGYHTAHLTELLREEGTSYIVLTPVVTDSTDHERYEELLLSHLKDQEKRLAASRSAGKKDTAPYRAQNVAQTKIPRGIRALSAVEGARLSNLAAPLMKFVGSRVSDLPERIERTAARLAANENLIARRLAAPQQKEGYWALIEPLNGAQSINRHTFGDPTSVIDDYLDVWEFSSEDDALDEKFEDFRATVDREGARALLIGAAGMEVKYWLGMEEKSNLSGSQMTLVVVSMDEKEISHMAGFYKDQVDAGRLILIYGDASDLKDQVITDAEGKEVVAFKPGSFDLVSSYGVDRSAFPEDKALYGPVLGGIGEETYRLLKPLGYVVDRGVGVGGDHLAADKHYDEARYTRIGFGMKYEPMILRKKAEERVPALPVSMEAGSGRSDSGPEDRQESAARMSGNEDLSTASIKSAGPLSDQGKNDQALGARMAGDMPEWLQVIQRAQSDLSNAVTSKKASTRRANQITAEFRREFSDALHREFESTIGLRATHAVFKVINGKEGVSAGALLRALPLDDERLSPIVEGIAKHLRQRHAGGRVQTKIPNRENILDTLYIDIDSLYDLLSSSHDSLTVLEKQSFTHNSAQRYIDRTARRRNAAPGLFFKMDANMSPYEYGELKKVASAYGSAQTQGERSRFLKDLHKLADGTDDRKVLARITNAFDEGYPYTSVTPNNPYDMSAAAAAGEFLREWLETGIFDHEKYAAAEGSVGAQWPKFHGVVQRIRATEAYASLIRVLTLFRDAPLKRLDQIGEVYRAVRELLDRMEGDMEIYSDAVVLIREELQEWYEYDHSDQKGYYGELPAVPAPSDAWQFNASQVWNLLTAADEEEFMDQLKAIEGAVIPDGWALPSADAPIPLLAEAYRQHGWSGEELEERIERFVGYLSSDQLARTAILLSEPQEFFAPVEELMFALWRRAIISVFLDPSANSDENNALEDVGWAMNEGLLSESAKILDRRREFDVRPFVVPFTDEQWAILEKTLSPEELEVASGMRTEKIIEPVWREETIRVVHAFQAADPSTRDALLWSVLTGATNFNDVVAVVDRWSAASGETEDSTPADGVYPILSGVDAGLPSEQRRGDDGLGVILPPDFAARLSAQTPVASADGTGFFVLQPGPGPRKDIRTARDEAQFDRAAASFGTLLAAVDGDASVPVVHVVRLQRGMAADATVFLNKVFAQVKATRPDQKVVILAPDGAAVDGFESFETIGESELIDRIGRSGPSGTYFNLVLPVDEIEALYARIPDHAATVRSPIQWGETSARQVPNYPGALLSGANLAAIKSAAGNQSDRVISGIGLMIQGIGRFIGFSGQARDMAPLALTPAEGGLWEVSDFIARLRTLVFSNQSLTAMIDNLARGARMAAQSA